MPSFHSAGTLPVDHTLVMTLCKASLLQKVYYHLLWTTLLLLVVIPTKCSFLRDDYPMSSASEVTLKGAIKRFLAHTIKLQVMTSHAINDNRLSYRVTLKIRSSLDARKMLIPNDESSLKIDQTTSNRLPAITCTEESSLIRNKLIRNFINYNVCQTEFVTRHRVLFCTASRCRAVCGSVCLSRV